MTLETFFEKFELFADTPDAVAKMRELVRHLAVTGRLVVQDAKDEPASKLLERIAAHKAALAKAGQLRGTTSVTSMTDGEGTFDLPSNWSWVRFGEIMVNRDGERIPVSKEERATKAKTYDYYGASGVIDRIDGYLFDKPLLLIGEDGANLINRSTPIAFMARGQYWVNNHAHVLDGISEDFLRFIELHINAINLESYVTGSAQPKMNQAKMNSIPIPLPPLAEQKRIVAKVDELMALCDRLEAQQQERETRHAALARASLARFADAPTPANLELLFHKSYAIPPADLRKSILTLAVQGKLVPQDPNDETVEELLKQNLGERRSLRRTEEVEPRPLAAEDALGYDIPESWRWQRLDDLLVFGPNNGFSPKAVDYKTPVRSLTLSATTSGRFKGEHSKFIATEVPADSDLWLRDGDILVQRGNTIDYVGVAAVYRGQPNRFIYPDLMMKLRVSSTFDVGYVHLAMSHDAARDFLRARASGTSGSMPKINQTTLKSLPLPLPPLAEQRRIVAKVEQLMALVDALEAQLAVSRATAENLLSALVAELTAT
jgi:type I restriction enzyme S subunit